MMEARVKWMYFNFSKKIVVDIIIFYTYNYYITGNYYLTLNRLFKCHSLAFRILLIPLRIKYINVRQLYVMHEENFAATLPSLI